MLLGFFVAAAFVAVALVALGLPVAFVEAGVALASGFSDVCAPALGFALPAALSSRSFSVLSGSAERAFSTSGWMDAMEEASFSSESEEKLSPESFMEYSRYALRAAVFSASLAAV